MEHILLLGDSLTELGHASGWVSRLSEHYVHRARVVNSGLRRYNTRRYLQFLRDTPAGARERLIPPLPSAADRYLFATLWLGANDLATNEQHVPLGEYAQNLQDIITDVVANVQPKAGVFVFTPPPVDGPHFAEVRRTPQYRTFAASRAYRKAALAVVAACQGLAAPVVAVDVHEALLDYGRPGRARGAEPVFEADAPWTGLLPDGLHVGPEGGALVFATLLEALRRSPRAELLDIQNIPKALPAWEDLDDDAP